MIENWIEMFRQADGSLYFPDGLLIVLKFPDDSPSS